MSTAQIWNEYKKKREWNEQNDFWVLFDGTLFVIFFFFSLKHRRIFASKLICIAMEFITFLTMHQNPIEPHIRSNRFDNNVDLTFDFQLLRHWRCVIFITKCHFSRYYAGAITLRRDWNAYTPKNIQAETRKAQHNDNRTHSHSSDSENKNLGSYMRSVISCCEKPIYIIRRRKTTTKLYRIVLAAARQNKKNRQSNERTIKNTNGKKLGRQRRSNVNSTEIQTHTYIWQEWAQRYTQIKQQTKHKMNSKH